MPTVKIIDHIKIDVYAREHPPPHFHARYAEYEELIEIENLATYAGVIPKVQRTKVIAWAVENKEYLMRVFESMNPRL